MSAGGTDGSSVEPGAGGFPGCRWAASLDDPGPGIQACFVGRALVRCVDDAGAGCQWFSEGPDACGSANGRACQSLCGPDEYAVACGLPGPQQQAPPECRPAGGTFEEYETLCCPCE
jgi:hypothetical protein